MRRLMLAAGAASLALAIPAFAQGQGQGQGKERGGDARGGPQAERGGGPGGGNARGPETRARGNDDRGPLRADNRGRGNDDRPAVADRGRGNDDRVTVTGRGNGRDGRPGTANGRIDDDARIVRRDVGNAAIFRTLGIGTGCPPGLDRKDNGCLPPGQARQLLGSRLPGSFANSLVPYAYRSWYRDNDDYFYRAGDGFIYRIDRDRGQIDGLIPTFGAGYYAVGDPWPEPYNFYNVPWQYRDYWADGGDYRYRYGDGAIYRINSSSGLVESIVALLAGDLGVGSRLPVGYDVYNVPFAYRDRYYDTPQAMYRYNDGYIYRVDPTTRLVTAVIDALV